MWGYGYGWWWPGMLLMGLFWIAVLGLIVWAVIAAVGRRSHVPPGGGPGGPGGPMGGPSAMEVLRQRYARGEIDDATYERMRERLEAAHSPGEQPPAATT